MPEHLAAAVRLMDDPASRAVIVAAARGHAFDFYLSALLAPRARRDDLIVLAAFEGELDRIAPSVSEPMLAEIRLQWWRDAIEAFATIGASGNPIADALAGVVACHRIEPGSLLASVDARSPLESEADAGGIADAQSRRLLGLDTAAMRRAARVFGITEIEGDDARFLEAAGLAVAHARALGLRPAMSGAPATSEETSARLAHEHLRDAEARLHGRSRHLRLCALPLALVRPQLRAWEKARRINPPVPAALLPLERVWRLWWFARAGRL